MTITTTAKLHGLDTSDAADHVDDNTDADDKDRQVLDVVRRLIGIGEEPNMRKIRAASPLRNAETADALERLVIAGELVESTGSRRARVFHPLLGGAATGSPGSHLKVWEPGTSQPGVAAVVPGTSGNQSGTSHKGERPT